MLDRFVILTGPGASALATPRGMLLDGGPLGTAGGGVRLFVRDPAPTAGVLRYRLTRLVDPPATPGGVWFNSGLVWGADPGELPPDAPAGDAATAALWRGWRVTHANRAHDGRARIKLRLFAGRERVEPTAAAEAEFRQGEPYAVALAWGGPDVALEIPALGAAARWSDEALRAPAEGARAMLYASPGGRFLVEDIEVAAR